MENNKYQQGKIYKIVCNITNEVYYGSTIETLNERLRLHKTKKNCMSRNILERGDYKIILIKDYPCNSKWDLEEEEAKYIRENECINMIIPHRTKKEWEEEHKEEIKKQKKEKYEKNKEEIKKKTKEYYEKNKEEINKKSKEKITCECGAIVNRTVLARHKKSMKHLKLTECIIID